MTRNSLFAPGPQMFSGGVKTFMTNLHAYLGSKEVTVSHSPFRSRVLFFPIHFERHVVDYVHSRGGRIIQRLDGIYYPQKHGEAFEKINKPVKDIYLHKSHHIVFQSEHSRDQCFTLFGEKRIDEYSIIVNGVNKALFKPSNVEPIGKRKFKLVTTGVYRNVDMVEPVIMALDQLVSAYDFELHLVGPVVNDELKPFLDRKYLKNYATHGLEETAECLRKCDLFIYSHLNPPCPNSVVEAVSCGLPVVGYDSGAMRELCHFNTQLLAPVSQDIFQTYDQFKPELLAEKLSYAMSHFEEVKKTALAHAHLYDFESCGQQYLEIFESADTAFSPGFHTVSEDVVFLWQALKNKLN
ncbi:MAG: glycosyltransferase [Cyclobacteriaceae bacterium]|nr:glycosyltransferase [Cyclobacteriaceae bacterium SS2]